MKTEEMLEMLERGELPPLPEQPIEPTVVRHNGLIIDFTLGLCPRRAAEKYRREHPDAR